ncbi:hypothetical protein P4N68_02145 [Corynebacterium felinum]|uniref:Uncharacterized protein n=1 Tax=Corynebacterium felinum TaxID=131318 RepID=A0ABU2BBH0_9CORY|nr:hypothetical protein [Corynebacterium felinum]MDF5819883.1 hypothetical protein [Corynebacterium felinum]MDR7355974.1 hypothetical protein [Corynebacterium felinum]WJY95310.1 hypothetical protein CFELI_08525 [Corynebacterium felinum]
MTSEFATLVTTYFIEREENLLAAQQRYIERVDAVRALTKVLWVSENITHEDIPIIKEHLLVDLNEDRRAIGLEPADEQEWELYSFVTIVEPVAELAGPDASVSRLWFDLRLADEEEYARSFISWTRLQELSLTGQKLPNGRIGG